MSQKYPGGVISKTAPVTVGPVDGEGGSAPGVWTLTQALELNKQGLWPKPPIEGQLWAWGRNYEGQLGQNNTTDRSSPVQVGALTNWAQSAVGTGTCLAVKSDGTLWAWGRNSSGQLGLNNTVIRSSPVQVGALTGWRLVSYGGYFSLAIKTNGTMWSWGSNSSGRLGLNDTAYRSSPVQVGALTSWSQIAAGDGFSAAVKTDGTLWTWGTGAGGSGKGGMLGLGDTQSRSSPTQVGSLTDWAKVATGSGHCIAIKTNGTLWAWGSNSSGQLGLGDGYVSPGNYSNRSSPVQVGALTEWADVAAGGYHSLAIKTNGTLWSWGNNGSGRLGQNNTINRSSPVQVGALTGWLQIAGFSEQSSAIKTNGTLWTWGRNNQGQLGQNSVINHSSPIQVGALTTWSKIARGAKANNMTAIKNP